MTDTPFHDFQRYLDLPRLAGLTMSPDGSRLVTVVSALNPERNRFRTALWELDPAGVRPARRLTRGPTGESAPTFTPDGDLLFVAARPDPGRTEQPTEPPGALWRLPAGGGEAQLVGTRPGGLAGPVVARTAGTVVASSMTLPEAVTADDDEARRKARTERKVSAILHAGYPVRFWDRDLGPDEPRLLAGTTPGDAITWRDLTPRPGGSLHEATYDISSDGATVVTDQLAPESGGAQWRQLVAIDVASGVHRVLAAAPGHEFTRPRISPDSQWVACIRETLSTPTSPADERLVVLRLADEPAREQAPTSDPAANGNTTYRSAPGRETVPHPAANGGTAAPPAPGREIVPRWDRWATSMRWVPDSSALIVTADDGGRAPLFRVTLDGAITRLTGDDAAYTDPQISPDGAVVYALRNAVDSPPAPVRLDAHTPDQLPVALPGPAPTPPLPGTLTEVHAIAADRTPLRAWLVVPESDEPAPLLLWVHGGPLASWNAWMWRWNPWLMAARGYAVLLPDPALSTGYGLDFVARGWGAWGAAPYTDLMALTDAACAHPRIDPSRTAAMGGSFGGYMANWIAGHTDRFAAIVTHASLWALDQFGQTTDVAYYWLREMTPQMAEANSPHRHADAITTPMLVIHGDRDYRVPIGEALRLWHDLVSGHPGDLADLPHRFLYFPDENHWILTPQNSALWYDTVHAFLAHHVLHHPWTTPDLLR